MPAFDNPVEVGPVTTSSAGIVLALTLAMTLSYCDRYAFNLVMEPIKHDLALSDTAVALVQGFAFSMFFVISGLPLGLLADRMRRLSLVATGVLLWSLATSACGLVAGFGGLLACRAAVAVGEAALTPAAFSIFADVLPRRRLGLGTAIFSLGVYVGAGLAFLGGAAFLAHLALSGGANLPYLGRVHDWQALFLLVGLPGVPLALWIASRREPPRVRSTRDLGQDVLSDVFAFARAQRRVLAPLFLCAGFAALTSQAYAAWMPSYLVRQFGWSQPQAGSLTGLVIITGGLAGVLMGGAAGDALRSRGRRDGRLIVMLGGVLAAAPFALAAPLMGAPSLALSSMLLLMFFTTMAQTAAGPAILEFVPGRMQGAIVALYALVITVVGLGLGPTLVALVTDHLLQDERRLGVSLASVSFASLCGAVLTGWSALKPYVASVSARE